MTPPRETVAVTSTRKARRSRRERRPLGTLFPAMGLLVRRRLWRDRVHVLGSSLIIALAALIAYGGPHLVLATIDEGVRDAVDAAGTSADVRVGFPVGNAGGNRVQSTPGVDARELDATVATLTQALPEGVAALVEDVRVHVVSPGLEIDWVTSGEEAEAAVAESRLPDVRRPVNDRLDFGLATDAELTVVSGRLPADASGETEIVESEFDALNTTEGFGAQGQRVFIAPEVIEVALSPAVAEVMDVALDDVVTLVSPLNTSVTLRVVGLVEPADPESEAWASFPTFTDPVVADNPALPLARRGTFLVTAPTLEEITSQLATPVGATVTLDMGADGLTLERASDVAQQIRSLERNPDVLLPDAGVAVTVSTALATTLEQYPDRARAAMAQMSVVVAGVIAVAGVVIALMARLLLARRETDISLERARGASTASVAARLTAESALTTAVGIAAGWGIATALWGMPAPWHPPALVVAVIGVIASPALGVARARAAWSGRRAPANRQDRAREKRARHAKRWTLEVLAVVVGVLAVVTLRGRGVTQTQTDGIDPFLAAAPVLLALAVVILVLRLYPVPMAIVQAIAKRTRGVAGAISLAKARQPMPALPLLALTLAIAVAVSGGLLVGTVRDGQVQASWERVGADVRVDAAIEEDMRAAIEAEGPRASRIYARPSTTFALGTAYEDATVVAYDEHYPGIVEAAGILDAGPLRELHERAATRGPEDPIPVLASAEVAALDFGEGRSELYIGRVYVPVEIVGVATVVPEGWLEGPFVMAPLEPLLEIEYENPIETNLALVTGADAAQAVEAVIAVEPTAITTREAWLAGVRDSALIGGVEQMMTIAVAAVGVLAAMALLVTVMQGLSDRARALSMLRTQGMSPRFGWWLAVTELGPLTVAAVVGGAGAGLAVLMLLGGTLGLEILSGGIEPPALVADVPFLLTVGAGVVVLLLCAVAVEVIAHRRDRLSDVLRSGESR